MNKETINAMVSAEAIVEEGTRSEWKSFLREVEETMKYESQTQVTFKVTYDNGQTVEVLAVDKFQASAEADEILVARGFSLDDLMFSPTVQAV